jgi:hypothetical protein
LFCFCNVGDNEGSGVGIGGILVSLLVVKQQQQQQQQQ